MYVSHPRSNQGISLKSALLDHWCTDDKAADSRAFQCFSLPLSLPLSLPRSIRPTVGRTQESLTLRYLDDEWVQYYTAEI